VKGKVFLSKYIEIFLFVFANVLRTFFSYLLES